MAIILNLNNQNAEFYYNLALEQMEAGIYYEAILNLIKANERADSPNYKLQLAEAYYHTQNFTQSTNIYIKLFFEKRRLAYILAIYRNLLLMGRTMDARKFILSCFREIDSIFTDSYEDLPEMEEDELQKVMGLAESEDFKGFLNLMDTYNESTLSQLKELVVKSDYDKAVMKAMEIPPESKLYDSAREIICICSQARGDYELAEKTAKELSFTTPDNVVAFGVLATMPDRVCRKEIEERAASLAPLIKNSSGKALDFLKTLSHTAHTDLFDKYLQEIYEENSCVFDIIAYKMFCLFAKGKKAEGKAHLKRLQMLFPNDFLVRAYTGFVDAGIPAHCWEELKFMPYCSDTEAVEKRFFGLESARKNKKKTTEEIGNLLCAMFCEGDQEVSLIIERAMRTCFHVKHTPYRFFEDLLSDINLSAEIKCDLIYYMLMYGWDSMVNVMMGDTFVRCRLESLGSTEWQIKPTKIYCEIYTQMISDGEVPNAQTLFEVIDSMLKIGMKKSMKDESLFAVAHYLYELKLGSEDEVFEEYIDIYDANPVTAQKYYEVFKNIIE